MNFRDSRAIQEMRKPATKHSKFGISLRAANSPGDEHPSEVAHVLF